MTTAVVDAASPTSLPRRLGRVGGLVVALVALLVLVVVSVGLGSRDVGPAIVWQAFTAPDVTADATVIREMRVPRTLIAVAVGAALGLGGAILQGLARNPLADSGVLGINHGAAVAVVIGAMVFGGLPISGSVWFAFAGAGIATVVVYGLAAIGREGATPVKLALAGAAITALCSSITSAIILSDPDALNELRMWQVGALGGRYFPVLTQLAPYFAVGIVLAFFAGRALNLLSLGDDLARTLGLRVGRTRASLMVLVTLLCGAATAACGPIAFVGLMVPHLARLFTGPDYRWILAYSALLGPTLVLGCDVLGRVILPNGEAPVGVVVGILGAPVFILLVRYRRMVAL